MYMPVLLRPGECDLGTGSRHGRDGAAFMAYLTGARMPEPAMRALHSDDDAQAPQHEQRIHRWDGLRHAKGVSNAEIDGGDLQRIPEAGMGIGRSRPGRVTP
jgi:hypothetical protein